MSAAGRLPRILTIMGSGETTPTMSRVHRSIFERLGGRGVPAVLLDTPYGFQENADDISARAVAYFRDTVGHEMGVASYRSAADDPLARETAVVRVRDASLVFTGPGSPSYALRQWATTEIPRLLAAKLAEGGAVTMASAAALTLGRFTIPVYEIYKVGEQPRWLEGLDLLGPLGLPVAVVPHYDNAEGGNHDTRFCYLGERRLRMLEAELPAEVFVLGVDGHTALVLDLDARTASVEGLGEVTVRKVGRSVTFPAGSKLSIDELVAAATGSAPAPAPEDAAAAAPSAPPQGPAAESCPRPLREEVAELERVFNASLEECDAQAAVRAILTLEETIQAWAGDTDQSDALATARSALRGAIVCLGEMAGQDTRDPRELIAPFVDALLAERLRAREAHDWAAADAIRDRLLEAGIELHDTPEGTTWELHPAEQAG
jgi:cyanophycinase-like exopeptidase